ncbi:nucleoside-diphosphate kinase [Micromonospora vulcania]|uniref:nucleoside-diphosphate kinase n=1 Tax=Micromonospora vulcania TaxID=1441873 RepID=A0ABW1HA13_9ACTN
MRQFTLVIVKPDAYSRGLTGEILNRFERAGLRIEAIRVSSSQHDMIDNHYPRDVEWLRVVGGKTLADHEQLGKSTIDKLGTDDAVEIGRIVRSRLVQFLSSGPLVPFILSGNRAIEIVRKIIGNTLPVVAAPGTIRGDLSVDSTDFANDESRPVANLVHASGDPDEAAREIALWFPEFTHQISPA